MYLDQLDLFAWILKLAVGFDYSDVIPISGIRVGDSDEKINTKIIIESKQ